MLLLDMGARGELEIAISDAILEEVLRVQGEKFKAPLESLGRTKKLIEGCTKRVIPTVKLNAVPNDPEDNKIIECAVASGSEAIITGDKHHLLKLGSYQGIRIVAPRVFLEARRQR